jgi:hypothetical protein
MNLPQGDSVKKLSTLLLFAVLACMLSSLSFAQTSTNQDGTQTKIVTNPDGSKKEIQKKDGKERRREVKTTPSGTRERRRQRKQR